MSSTVSFTSSVVRTMPAMEMGPASKRESLAVVVAVAVRLPSVPTVAVAAKVTGTLVPLMVTKPSMAKRWALPSVSGPRRPVSFDTFSSASGKRCDWR